MQLILLTCSETPSLRRCFVVASETNHSCFFVNFNFIGHVMVKKIEYGFFMNLTLKPSPCSLIIGWSGFESKGS